MTLPLTSTEIEAAWDDLRSESRANIGWPCQPIARNVMAWVIRVVGFASGAPCPVAGMFVKRFDFEANDGRGLGTFTPDTSKAMKFANTAEATAFWRTQSTVRPKRADGKPNRPFTGSTVEMVSIPGDDALH